MQKFIAVVNEVERYRELSEKEKEGMVLSIMGRPYMDLRSDWAFKQLLLAKEIRLHGGHQQALPKAAGTAEEKVLAAPMGKIVNEFCLVHIDKAISADILKVLYANRIFHARCTLCPAMAKE